MLDLFVSIDIGNCRINDLPADNFTKKFWIDCLYFCKRVRFFDLPQEYQTKDFMEEAKKQYPEIVCKFPLFWSTKDEIIHGLQINGLLLKHINVYDEIFFEVACRQNGLAYKYVPEYAKTEELLRIAVSSNPRALLLLTKEEKNPEIYMLAVNTMKSKLPEIDYEVLKIIPKKYIDFKIPPKKEEKEVDERIFTHLDTYYADDEMYSEYVDIFVDAIPKEYVTEEFWSNYLLCNIYSCISEIPKEVVTDELRCEYYELNCNATFKDLPKEKQTKEYCFKVFHKTKNLKKLPFEYITIKEIKEAIRRDHSKDQITYILDHIEELHEIDLAEVFQFVDFDRIRLTQLKPEYVTDKLVKAILKKDPHAILRFLRKAKMFPAIDFIPYLEYAISLNWTVFEEIPDIYKNYSLCLKAVSRSPKVIFSVPEKFRDEQIKEIAYTKIEDTIPILKHALQYNKIFDNPPIGVAYKILEQSQNVCSTEEKEVLLAKIRSGDWLTFEKANNIVRLDPKSISFFFSLQKYYPQIDFQTLSEIACSQNGLCLKDIPNTFRSKKVCDCAVRNTVLAYDFIPPAILDEDLIACTLEEIQKQLPKIKGKTEMRKILGLYQEILKKIM